MNKDLLLLIKHIRQANDVEDLKHLKSLSDTVLRGQKRDAILTLLAISEELGKDEIIVSLEDLTKYLKELLQDSPSKPDSDED